MSDKSIYSCIRDVITGREHVRVAVIGGKESGKTVLLTALSNYLRDPEGDLDEWKVIPREADSFGDGGIPPFEYGKARSQLSSGEWPDNTRALSIERRKFCLERKIGRKYRRRTVVLELLDLPGERVADLSMVGRSFADWSEWMEKRFGGVDGVSPRWKEYVQDIESADNQVHVIDAYKRCVAGQYADGLMTITPSVLKLGLNGEYLAGVTASEFRQKIGNVPVGIDVGSQFAPLPGVWLSGVSVKHREMVKAFERAYNKYKKEVVNPIYDWISRANKAVYLIDVLALLRNGPEAYNAEKDFANQALMMFRRSCADNQLVAKVQRVLTAFVRTHADGVYVVATKADTVVGEQNRSRMKGLAGAMMKTTLLSLGLRQDQVETLSCASVVTSEEYGKEKALKARIEVERDASGCPRIEERTYAVADVPMEWPDDDTWRRIGSAFDFRPTFPKFDTRKDKSPKHLGLDCLLCRLLSLKGGM